MVFRASIDGAARGNPGPAGAGVYVEPDGDRPAEELFEPLTVTEPLTVSTSAGRIGP